MANFNFTDAASKGYEFIWRERGYLSRVAFPVLFVKLACSLAVFALGAEDQYLRQGLILIPGFIVEAIFIIGLIRYTIYREAIFIWGKLIPPPLSDVKSVIYHGFMSRKQCVQGGIALYLLLRIFEAFISGIFLGNTELPSSNIPEEDLMKVTPVMMGVIVLFSFVIFVWSFRFFWLFIPTALGYKISYFVKKLTKFRDSIALVAVWFICSLPLMVLFSSILQGVSNGFPEGSFANIFSTSIVRIVAELIIVSIQVVAITYGINKLLSNEEE